MATVRRPERPGEDTARVATDAPAGPLTDPPRRRTTGPPIVGPGDTVYIQRSKRSLALRPEGFVLGALGVLSFILWFTPQRAVRPATIVTVGLAILCVVDYLSASRAVHRFRFTLSGPRTALARQPLTIDVMVHELGRTVRLDVPHEICTDGYVVDATGPAHFTMRSPTRGTLRFIYVDVHGRGLFGLWRMKQRRRVWLRRPIFVAPAPDDHPVRWPKPRLDRFGDATATTLGHDLYRSSREYQRGDSRRSIHWPGTAHTGSLMVREMDGTGVVVLRLIVELGPGGRDAEETAARALWLAEDARRRGWVVNLVTLEIDGPVPMPAPLIEPTGRFPAETKVIGPVSTIERLVDDEDDLRHRLAVAAYGWVEVEPAPGLTRLVSTEGDRWL